MSRLERHLDEHAVHIGISVGAPDRVEQRLGRRPGRQSDGFRADPDLTGGPLLRLDVGLGGGVAAEKNDGEPGRRREGPREGRGLFPDPLRHGSSLEEFHAARSYQARSPRI